MLTTYTCAPGCHREREAEEHTGGPGCTSVWDCAGRCAPPLQGGTYSPKQPKWKKQVTFVDTVKVNFNLLSICLEKTWKRVGGWVMERVCLSFRVDRGRFDRGHDSALASFKAAGRSSDDPANHTSMTDTLYFICWCQRV